MSAEGFRCGSRRRWGPGIQRCWLQLKPWLRSTIPLWLSRLPGSFSLPHISTLPAACCLLPEGWTNTCCWQAVPPPSFISLSLSAVPGRSLHQASTAARLPRLSVNLSSLGRGPRGRAAKRKLRRIWLRFQETRAHAHACRDRAEGAQRDGVRTEVQGQLWASFGMAEGQESRAGLAAGRRDVRTTALAATHHRSL
ncbi:hypothetical protein SKAU_G00053930 [Synaphobranchus kaupii]|uniref:Uncharacterized protein n=1 Tax=Synaphobranchus kaupii TaxID=118154 RepID=A0A9Q1G3H9_SYNKA|nr:hypothetical protein SKAU_G00053930 [Synaphobranchus kaupii]